MGKLFGTDGIRGEANRYPMNAEIAFSIGQAVTRVFNNKGHKTRVIIGKDTRISGYMLESSLEAGISSMGGISYLVRVLPTPGIAFITESMRADAGIVISASHNPFQDNGIKIFGGNGYKLSDRKEEEIEDLILNCRLPDMVPPAREMGRSYRMEDASGRYIVFLKNTFPRHFSIEGVKIALDVSNGAAYRVAPAAFAELGAQISVINDEPDGLNINDNCGSQFTEGLQRKVLGSGSAVGFAFDGDGDRLIAVDEKGRRITGDQILIICAKYLRDTGRLKNNLLISTIMSNIGLSIACGKLGFSHYASKVGDRYVLEDMQRLGAVIGGEDSGHTIFLNHHTTGDGILTAIQLLAAMISENKPLSELAGLMEIFPQALVNVEVESKPDISTVPPIVEAIEAAEQELGKRGRVLVRYSGTQKMCRVMVEGPDEETTWKLCDMISGAVKSSIGGSSAGRLTR